MKKRPLKEHLSDSLVTGDGAMATYLYQQGVSIGHCNEELVLSNPAFIANVHKAYYEAGARLIETNTYGANRERLTRYGLESKVTRINREAVKLARNTVGEDAYVVGSIGSICAGRVLAFDEDEYRDMYEEQATALLHAGVDGILLETFLDLKEVLVAVDAIRPLTDLPLIAQLSTIEVGRTRDAFSLSEAFQILARHGVDGVGLNCRLGPMEILRSLEKTVVPEHLILSAFPNAGRLGVSDGEFKYKSSPGYFEETADLLVAQGVRLLGGCCGTTPDHIRRVAAALAGKKPVQRVNPELRQIEVTGAEHAETARKKPTVVDKVKYGRTIICEFDTPKGLDISGFLAGAERLHQAGVDTITMADNSLATARMSNLAAGAILKSQLGIEPLVHVACRDRNLLGQQSHLMGLHALGIDQILVITGDPTRVGDLPGASSIYDVTSFELIRMVKQLNEGISFSGKQLKQKASFVVGTAFNPHVRQLDAAVRRLEKKVAAGADFIMTQPVYDEKGILDVYEATKDVGIPTFIGIMPLTGYRNALFLHNEVPGIKIPQSVLQRMEAQTDKESARREGVEITKNLLDVAMEKFRGIYLITPFSFWQMTVELTSYIRRKDHKRAAAQVS
ncbi:bifunctional homocysteine S-methyltransferase/methylenetetrahydrofolate reductase [Paenactinomyces guangxiensis]|uniref:Bifunctional homocysteine S-methyltransferase/methylenetetrahydrofolate reductase n=1 Tax=Paenactinomyces guangxiensis TaxID=1490290 RepID=A0A7W2A873_9BACL|nr:bifunctional homocysteine S-methyltransferase/methylenetetrahydrofolate reductase [Paenactinomyces guangxiensis]MBA4493877.1 bifunctional homocysteine S-methyltransferase/methylenetetrahydrofolate reductase [Paenactinomyces guangxiensis]MBH8591343.1 bifunctional homocysteine S-methyltransferase/methylenetetrahydrofolate reductase [Paenactinomyces guangxiensis]